MGVEYIIINRDKRELLDFDALGFGTKISAMTSEPLASFLAWLLVNRDGYDTDSHLMLGRWAGDRVEMIGDSSEQMQERLEQIQREFKDITAETIEDYARWNPCACIDLLHPMGLIDSEGKVTFTQEQRANAAEYWRKQQEKEAVEAGRFLDGWPQIETTLRSGTVEQVLALRCPVNGGHLKVDYREASPEPPYLRVQGVTSELRQHVAKVAPKPPWMSVLGTSFQTG
jgi:hypothetical protein